MKQHSFDLDTEPLYVLFVFSSKRDGGNVDHPNGNAQSIPMNSIKPQNEEEDEAPNGHALTAHG